MATLTTSFGISVVSDAVKNSKIVDDVISGARAGNLSDVYGKDISITLSNGAVTKWRTQDINDNGDVIFVAYQNGIYGNFADAGTHAVGSMQLCKTEPSSAISWKDTDLRTFLNNEYFNTMPSWIKEKIKKKTHRYQIGNWNQLTAYDEVSDNIWIPTLANVIGPPASTNTTWKAFDNDKRFGVYAYYTSMGQSTPSSASVNFSVGPGAWTATPYKSNPNFTYISSITSAISATEYRTIMPAFIVGS